MRAADDAARPGAPVAPAADEPHLTFEMLLADTLHAMTEHEEAASAEPDEVERLRDHALASLRAAGQSPLTRPFHHSYLTPIGTPVQPSRPARLDVRS